MANSAYSQQKDMRQQNAAALLDDLWHHAPLSRAMLAKRNQLTKATVSAICRDLAELGLIREVGQDRTALGRPGNLIELNPSSRCAIGVEVATNYVAVALVDLSGEPVWLRGALVEIGSRQEVVLAQAEALVFEAVDQARQRGIPLLGLGVGVPGLVEPGPSGRVTAPALGWTEVPLKQIWEACFSMPVIVENKARAAAMAEALRGSADRVTSFVYVSIGTDVRASVEAAVVTGGLPYHGAHGRAVDAGHMVLDPQGPLCSCGQRGCWQVMADVDREAELVCARLAAGERSVLERYFEEGRAPLDHQTIHQAAVEGDAVAREAASSVLMNHALGIANLVRLFDPELVVIGFANVALPEAYLNRMEVMKAMPAFDVPEEVRRLLSRRGMTPPSIVFGAHGPEACMLGAAAVVIGEFLRKPPAYEAQS